MAFVSLVKLSNKLCCTLHISYTCKSAASQLNALVRLKSLPDITNTCFWSNISYCLLVSMFTTSSFAKNPENFKKRALQFSTTIVS